MTGLSDARPLKCDVKPLKWPKIIKKSRLKGLSNFTRVEALCRSFFLTPFVGLLAPRSGEKGPPLQPQRGGLARNWPIAGA
jgi:hypothetical protein